jgi:hypothetical protein
MSFDSKALNSNQLYNSFSSNIDNAEKHWPNF